MVVELIYLVNDEVIKVRVQTNRIESIVREYPCTRFYSINHKSPHKEWIVYVLHGEKVVSYPTLFKPVKLLTLLLLTDIQL